MKISNPVLPGFNADPSMIRVGDTYYIANSTFDWWPGVRLHESRDMVHWNLLPGPLNRVSQLDMKGNPSGGGIWAPDLSYADGKFWLIYTDVKIVNGAFKDCANYLSLPRTSAARGASQSVSMAWASTPACSMIPMDASIWCSKPGTSVNIIIRSTASP